MAQNPIAKSSLLHRWKQGFYVLHKTGRVMYYDSETSSSSEDFIHIPAENAHVLGPEQCVDVSPPEGKSPQWMFGLQTQNKTWYMCADDEDEMLAWKLSLEEARNIQPYNVQGGTNCGVPPGMQAYYPGGQYRFHGSHNPQYIQAPPGSTVFMTQQGPVVVDQYGNQVVYLNQHPHYYGRRRGDAAMGFVAGAALGSMLFWPWMMMPLWCW